MAVVSTVGSSAMTAGWAPRNGDELLADLYEAEPEGIDAADLLALDLPALRWVIPGLLPQGTTILASPPKVGKSCLVYQIAVEVAVGGYLFGRRVDSGSALYLALEDGKRRGQDRLRAALASRTMPRDRLEIRWSARRIGEGLEESLARWLDTHPDAGLVAIDTLQRVRPRTTGRRNAYEVDVEDLARLQDLFRDRQVALLIVHHSRKESGDDFLASVSGTYGLTGSADTTAVIRRKRLEEFGTIVVTGRDVAEAELPVRFDGMTWHEAPGALPMASFERAEVFRVIEQDGPIFPAAIAERLGVTRQTVQNMVAKLAERGAVTRTARGYVAVTRDIGDMRHRSSMSLADVSSRETQETSLGDPVSTSRTHPGNTATTVSDVSGDSGAERHQRHRGHEEAAFLQRVLDLTGGELVEEPES
jgi:hypothetical protein